MADPSLARLDSLLAAVMRDADNGMWRAMYVAEQLGGKNEGALDLLAAIIVDERWPRLARTHGLRRLAEAQHDVVLQIAELRVEDEDPITRSLIAESLGKLDDPAVVPYLERLLIDESLCVDLLAFWRVMDEAARSLVRWRARCPAYDFWVEARLHELDGEGEGRDMAVISLGYVRHNAAIAPLVEEAKGYLLWALDLLETYRSVEVADALCAALPEADDVIRNVIAQSLGKNGDPSCIPTLSQMLADRSGPNRFAAARGLRWLEHEDARRVLADYRDDLDAKVRDEVRLAEEPAGST